MKNNQQTLTQRLSRGAEVSSILFVKEHKEKLQYVLDFGEISLLLPDGILSEVIEVPRYAYMPLMPAHVSGLFNLRGNLIPVFDLYRYLSLPNQGKSEYIIALGKNDDIVGVLLKTLPRPIDQSTYQLVQHVPNLPASLERYTTEIFQKENEIVIAYRHKEFFASLCH